MNKYTSIKINNIEYLLIDTLKYNNKNYILTKRANELSNLEILIFDEKNSLLINLIDKEEYNIIITMFENKKDNKNTYKTLFDNIKFDNLIKLKVIDIDKYNYKLEYKNDILIKNIEFYSENKPDINNYIYISKNVLNENVLSYGKIKYFNNLNENILIIEKNDKKIYLERQYG